MKTPINELPDKWRDMAGLNPIASTALALNHCAKDLEAALKEAELGSPMKLYAEETRVRLERDQARRYAEAMFPFWPAQKPLPWVKVDKTPNID